MMAKTILDVSRWQGNINWNKVKASGLVSGVMLWVLVSWAITEETMSKVIQFFFDRMKSALEKE